MVTVLISVNLRFAHILVINYTRSVAYRITWIFAMPDCSLMRDVLAYSRTALLGLRKTPNSLKFMFVDRLSALNALRFRGSRAGQLTRVHQARSFVDKQMRAINHTSVDSDGKPLPITTIIGRRVGCCLELEILAVSIQAARRSILVIAFYWPGSTEVNNAFFNDFDDVLERADTFACPPVLLGDVNIHMDEVANPLAVRFQSLLDSYGLVQNVSTPTRGAHILDVIITRSEHPSTVTQIEPPGLSDHSFIMANMNLQFNHGASTTVVRCRHWRKFDFDKFCADLKMSTLLNNPPGDAADLFTCYDETLKMLVDKHAPLTDVKVCSHQNAPWYDNACRTVKKETRRLESIYRVDGSTTARKAWRDHSRYQRFFLNEKYVRYWSDAITKNAGDSKALWSKVSALLKAPSETSSTSTIDFSIYFKDKVDTIRATTADAPPPVIEVRPCCVLSSMRRVTAAEITKIITNSPAKHCSLDSAPTWLVKRALPLLADTIALMCNTSITEGVFPDALKHAIVRPRLKKSTLDPTQLSSYRPISNLSFVSKTVERVIAACFSEHVEENNLLPSRQSAYRPYHSTETAVMAVHDEIVRKIDNGQVCALVLLDLSAAFDTVDHDTLRQVLSRRFGVQGSMMAWFDSYLTNRTQTFQFGTNQSGPHRVDCSVPQGSVLGPQEFTAYTDNNNNNTQLITRHKSIIKWWIAGAEDQQVLEIERSTVQVSFKTTFKRC